jgi:hypothetical protein
MLGSARGKLSLRYPKSTPAFTLSSLEPFEHVEEGNRRFRVGLGGATGERCYDPFNCPASFCCRGIRNFCRGYYDQ